MMIDATIDITCRLTLQKATLEFFERESLRHGCGLPEILAEIIDFHATLELHLMRERVGAQASLEEILREAIVPPSPLLPEGDSNA